jgi:hypothetical protein
MGFCFDRVVRFFFFFLGFFSVNFRLMSKAFHFRYL